MGSAGRQGLKSLVPFLSPHGGSSVSSREFGALVGLPAHPEKTQQRSGGVINQLRLSQSLVSSKEMQKQHTQVLKNKLEGINILQGPENALALVLSRSKKAQRMRELQQQAALAWEAERSDQKVQLTLERSASCCSRARSSGSRTRDAQGSSEPGAASPAGQASHPHGQQESSGWKAPLEGWEKQRQEEAGGGPPPGQAEPEKQCQGQRLPERMLRDCRCETACSCRRLAQASEARSPHQEGQKRSRRPVSAL